MSSPLPVNAGDAFGRRRGAPRKEVLAGSVSDDEKRETLKVMAENGFPNMSEAVREICLAYAESPTVREAVHSHLKSRAA